ncbi:LysM peptidoglycan-binding domain-containing protein [Maribellus maritimus]|uniref:LysM peptidoglycan-binding domain-containing protein n=1 Tax=Maribellus maritimus TaxID=2870838 RepID=UPI001EEC132B|nr:LysM peptidoglycan-binding domain-containing protein [Maribellus maritimus]MCG6189409.1 LysM peptidoglycan-binding domain-containing protein [Maribellus maritimus]
MNLNIKNIVLILLAVSLVCTSRINAQSDTIPGNYFSVFTENINQISGLIFFSQKELYPGKFTFENTTDFSEVYKSLHFPVFPEAIDKSEEYFSFLNSLAEDQKKNLVQLFSFYEKDFETEFKKAGLPVELKYLAPAISVLNVHSTGEGKRAGIWHLSHFQALLNGGEVTRLVDERLDVIRSTRLAARDLKQNLEIYNNTELAVLAFISGNTAVKNAIHFAGESSGTAAVLSHLSGKVAEQIAAFQAMAAFLNTSRFFPEPVFYQKKNAPDTVKIYRQLHFKQIEKVIGVSAEQISDLNPQYKYSIVPENSRGRRVALPKGKRDDFVLWNDSINNATDSSYFQLITQKIEYPSAPNRQYLGEPVKDLEIEGKTKIKYRLKTGDVLGIIAETYDVRIADLKYWNNIVNERRIQAGQMIDIFVPDDQVDYYRSLENQTAEKSIEKEDVIDRIQSTTALKVYEQFDTNPKIEHVVKNGESPFVIAKQYDGVTPELILEWNNIDNPRKIQIGQKLIIYPRK